MNEIKYKATLSGEQGRSGWCMIFRHPLRKNPDGTPVRVRRGLGTKDKTEAEGYLGQMNQILLDMTFWNTHAKGRAEALFHPKVVAAFYDDLLPENRSPWSLRDEVIALPGPAEGYARARMVGTTGSGKTTVARQLLGMDPKKHRFPSTSTAKTTVCDMEVVFGEGPFKAVVTFFSEAYARLHIDECAMAVVWASVAGQASHDQCVDKLLEHTEQKFRLSYILGNAAPTASDALTENDDDDEGGDEDEVGEVSVEQREEMSKRIHGFVSRIVKVGQDVAKKLETHFGMTLSRADGDDESAFQKLLEHELRLSESFHDLVDEVLEAVKERFELLDATGLRYERDWPVLWQYENANQEDFIKVVNRFSSNYAPNFGRLLTPLVQGLRVHGPFLPKWLEAGELKLVLEDGEGFGHTPESSNSISTTITDRFKETDAILLVDNAEQPIQAAPEALLRTLASSGQEGKLIVAFTHLDEVKGDNLPDVKARKLHVQRSLDNAITNVGEALGGSAENALRRATASRTFFLSKIDKEITSKNTLTISEFRRMLVAIQDTIKPKPPTSVKPVYDMTNLVLGIPIAVGKFRDPWRARLGFSSHSKIRALHWATVKALSRRFAELGEIEYSGLMPVADLIRELQERMAVVLGTPLKWEPDGASEEMKRQVVNEILDGVANGLTNLSKTRLFQERTTEWGNAYYSHSGPGSTRGRAHDIDMIYDIAAPTPTEMADENASKFVAAITAIVKEAVTNAGGRFQ
jgi:hypothetical protein